MNRFRKINDVWCIEIGGEPTIGTLVGQTVTVTLASGATKQVTLGAYLGNGIYANAPLASAPKVEIGSLDGIIALFDKAAARLKFPAVVLDVPGYEDGVRISRAGARAKQPGTLNVTNGAKDDSEYGRTWFGRVGLDGVYSPSRDATPEIAAALKAFAADPVKVATAYGKVKRSQIEVRNADGTVGFKLVGQCCFCRKALTDERSTDVGYGKICAGHYGLPWGATAVADEQADDALFHQQQAFDSDVAREDAELAQRELAADLRNARCEHGAEVLSRDEQQAHYASATDGSYDGQEDYENAARRSRLTGYWSPRNRARYQD